MLLSAFIKEYIVETATMYDSMKALFPFPPCGHRKEPAVPNTSEATSFSADLVF